MGAGASTGPHVAVAPSQPSEADMDSPSLRRVTAECDVNPHCDGFVPGRWAASSNDAERVKALRQLGILMTVRHEP